MGVGSQRHAPAALPPGKIPGIHCTGGWVGSRAGLDGYGKSRPHRDSIPSQLRVATPTELFRPTRITSTLHEDLFENIALNSS